MVRQKEIKGTFFVDSLGKEVVESTSEAVAKILEQLNVVSKKDLFSEGFVWCGEEVVVPNIALNPVMRALEAVNRQNSVVIFPVLSEGPGKYAEYAIKPVLWNSEQVVKMGLRITSDLEEDETV